MKYEEALQQLETIVKKMEAGEYDIDELSEQLKQAQKLIKQIMLLQKPKELFLFVRGKLFPHTIQLLPAGRQRVQVRYGCTIYRL